jgi:hypothetical protein
MPTLGKTFWDGTDAPFVNWSGDDPGMPDQASPPPQTVVASSSGGTSPTSGDGPPSDNAPNLASGGSGPAASPVTWTLPTPLPSGLSIETQSSGGDASPTSAAGAPYSTWVLPTPLPSSPPSGSVTGGGDLTSTFASGGSDPLVAFLDGLQGLSNNAGPPSNAFADSTAPMLSNGLNADAGVAQLVNALASLHDGSSAFDATPFATSGDLGPQVTLAAAAQVGGS